jgi:hypothetical protein
MISEKATFGILKQGLSSICLVLVLLIMGNVWRELVQHQALGRQVIIFEHNNHYFAVFASSVFGFLPHLTTL